ncbi:MAG TPA: hypothetical protein VIJ66_04805 [Solirubrobacteraceae bacterium]
MLSVAAASAGRLRCSLLLRAAVALASGELEATTIMRAAWPPPSTLTSWATCSRIGETVPSSAVSTR